MSKKNKLSGEERFEEYYKALYQERWEGLKDSLLKEKESSIEIPNLKSPYYLDIASYKTASLLPVEPGMNVLDMCAAPGGKTLVIAKKLSGLGALTSNDRSPDRRERLRKVIHECLDDKECAISKVTGFDATSWGVYEKDVYDAILLDAPCSSERHVINSEKHLADWSPNRPKRLAITQYAMLSSALLAVKKGGYILYSTCSINPEENECVIEKLVKKHKEEVEFIPVDIDKSENLSYGNIVLPDRANGMGPMYACLMRKI